MTLADFQENYAYEDLIPFPYSWDNIWAMMIFWRINGKIILGL